MIDIEKCVRLRDELQKNQTILKVYNTRDNSKRFIEEIVAFREFNRNDYEEIFNAFKHNLKFISDYALEDYSSSKNIGNINTLIFDINQGITENDTVELFFENLETKSLLICLQNMLVLYSATSTIERSITSFLRIDEKGKIIFNYKNDRWYYRGENNYSYKLLPSLYRNYDVSKYGSSIDDRVLFALYQDSNLVKKYATIFTYTNIDYSFCAYMQHSKSYSPFLDLTSDPSIGLSFATKSLGDLNNYMNSNASLYVFQFNNVETIDEDNEMFFRDYNVFISDNRLRVSSFIRDRLLCKCTYLQFEPKVYILNQRVNDRMKYQKGSFLYINQSVIINGILLLPLSVGKIIKYKIPANDKVKIYKANKRTNPHYDYEHLMDPYKYFYDAPDD